MRDILTAIFMFFSITLVTGLVYPYSVRWLGTKMFPNEIEGSLIIDTDSSPQKPRILGSKLLGQNFTSPRYFWGRPLGSESSAGWTGPSNAGPTSKSLLSQIESRKINLIKNGDSPQRPIPPELLMASASGLDPDLSPQAVHFQIPRILKERNISPQRKGEILKLVAKHTIHPLWDFWGQTRVNVLQLNLELDRLFP